MPIKVLMPALSPTMTEGTLAKWIRTEGDAVTSGDVIAEIETDKATMEVEAVDEGTLGKILVPEGTQGVAVNAPIAVLLEEGESAEDIKPEDPPVSASAPVEGTAEAPEAASSSAPPVPVEKGARIKASPLARRMAGQKGLDLSAIKGSGPGGRIVKADVENARPGAKTPASAPAGSGPNAQQLADLLGMAYDLEPNSGVRKTIARRLQESKQIVPHFYLTVECRLDALLAARKDLNDRADGAYKLSVNDFVLMACAKALKAYPDANVAWTDDNLVRYKHADISVAVATPNGLITPIVKAAEEKTIFGISKEVKDLARRARDGKLRPEEFQGGTFSLSNLGMFGVKEFSAIINPPQACILAVGAGAQVPVVNDGRIEVATVMNCTLSVDHRAVDGAVGAEFLQIFKRLIENPTGLFVE